MTNTEFHPLLEVGISMLKGRNPYATEPEISEMSQALRKFINGEISFSKIQEYFIGKKYDYSQLEKIKVILAISNAPWRSIEKPKKLLMKSRMNRSKVYWDEASDLRLLAAIHKYGLDDWYSVAQFVGSPMTCVDCSQRWFRRLDPRISTELMNENEDKKLQGLAECFNKDWRRVSQEMGNRTETQCRFRYNLISKKPLFEQNSDYPIVCTEETVFCDDRFMPVFEFNLID